MPDLLQGLTYADLIGSIGTLAIVATYFATQILLMNSSDPAYPLINLAGSALIAISLSVHFNLASALMEAFWMTISAIGIWRGFLERR